MANTISRVLTGVANVEIKYPVGGAYVDAGYTEDGVNFEYNADSADIDVEEETMSIDRVLTKEVVAIILNMAEASLYNMDKAMAGSVLAGSTISIGDGVNKQMSIKVTGTNPDGFDRTITMALATAVGTSSHPYKRGEKTVVPVRFEALKTAAAGVTIVDSTS